MAVTDTSRVVVVVVVVVAQPEQAVMELVLSDVFDDNACHVAKYKCDIRSINDIEDLTLFCSNATLPDAPRFFYRYLYYHEAAAITGTRVFL